MKDYAQGAWGLWLLGMLSPWTDETIWTGIGQMGRRTAWNFSGGREARAEVFAGRHILGAWWRPRRQR